MEVKRINFWCHTCREDFHLLGHKRWVNSVIEQAWTSDCPDCGKMLYRLRDEMAMLDPYFRQSRYVFAQRRRNQDYLVQPGSAKYNMLYPSLKKEQIAKENEQDRIQHKTLEDIAAKYGND